MAIAPEQVDQVLQNSAIPIIIGVTGHRDLRPEDAPQLQGQVRAILEELRKNYPATPLLVLAPLAEGADRLVARVALEQSASLVVPLPLPREEYEKDFQTQDSKNEFRDLLNQASKCFELPSATGNSSTIPATGPVRDRLYTQVGAYIAHHSHILIALWDGERTAFEGGTARIVDFKLNGIPEPYARPQKPLDAVDNGPVYHILTPRVPSPPGEPCKLQLRFPQSWTSSEPLEKSYGRILKQMDAFNDDASRLGEKLVPAIRKNRNDLLAEPAAAKLTESARRLLDQYAVADTLAIYFQKRRRLTLVTLFVVAVLAVLTFEIYGELLAHPLVLAGYPLLLAGALSLYLLSERKRFQNKHLDYRALAEGFRVQFFWQLAGLTEQVADHYLRQHRTELEWIRNAIRGWNIFAQPDCISGSGPDGAGGSMAMVEFVGKHWVEAQGVFFSRSTTRDHKKLGRRERLAQWSFGFGLALAALVFCLHFVLSDFNESSYLRHLLIVVMGITPVIAAAIGGYAEKMAFSAQAKRYDWTKALFNRAATQLRSLVERKDLAGAQQLIFDLGKEALEENGNWVMIHRERTADVYKGA